MESSPPNPVVAGESQVVTGGVRVEPQTAPPAPAPTSALPIASSSTLPSPAAPTTHRTAERQRVRHSFDVFADQILALRDVALQRELRSGQHARLGDLVQEALDAFLAREPGAALTSGGTSEPNQPG